MTGRAEYLASHKRVYRLSGRASDYQCYLCFDRARERAWLWRTFPDPADPWGHIPLCRQDHNDYDHGWPGIRAYAREGNGV